MHRHNVVIMVYILYFNPRLTYILNNQQVNLVAYYMVHYFNVFLKHAFWTIKTILVDTSPAKICFLPKSAPQGNIPLPLF